MYLKITEKKFAFTVYSIAVFTVIMYLSRFMTFFNVISMLNQLSHKFLRFILCCTNGVCTLHQFKSMQYWYEMTGKHEATKKFSTGVCSIHL
jgi:hypothetical protein